MHLLVVEDSRTQAMELELILKTQGHHVTTCHSLTDAKACLNELGVTNPLDPPPPHGASTVDAVLLDLHLPDASGLDTLDQLHAACPTLPIVVITALGDTDQALTALKRGAQEYVFKDELQPRPLGRIIRYAVERQRDALERDALTVELQRKNDKLERLDALKNEFLGIAAHDLRSPLGVILGYCQLLTRMDDDTTFGAERDIFETIQRSTEFMWRLVNDLLDVSTIEAGRLNLNLAPHNLNHLLATLIDRSRILARHKSITLQFHGAPEVPPITIDPHKIEQVMNNLIDNAIKFSDSGTQITVTMMRRGDALDVSVADQGIGVSPDTLKHLFDPFHRGQRRGTEGERSTGLGLAIARKIVESHGGSMAVESEVGVGTTFTFSLPLQPPPTE